MSATSDQLHVDVLDVQVCQGFSSTVHIVR